MVSFSALTTCANGASEPGNRVISARTRHGDTARANTRDAIASSDQLSNLLQPVARGRGTNLQMPGLLRFSKMSEGFAALLHRTARVSSP
jgi:hypothetical protein